MTQDNKQLKDSISDLKKENLIEKQSLEKQIQQQKELSFPREALKIETERTEKERSFINNSFQTPSASSNTINNSFNISDKTSTPGPKLKAESEEVFLVINI